MRFTCGFAALALTLLAGSSIAQCPGGMNFELTALTVPQAAVAPLPKLPSAPPPPPPKKQVKPPKKQKVPTKPAPRPEPEREREREPEPEAAPPPREYPQRNRTDAALDDMIGSFNSRPRSGPNIDYTAPMTPNRGLGEALRQDAAIRDHVGRRHRERERRRERTPRQPTTPQETTPQSTPQTMPQSHDEPHNEPGPTPVTGPALDSFDVR